MATIIDQANKLAESLKRARREAALLSVTGRRPAPAPAATVAAPALGLDAVELRRRGEIE